MPKPESETEPTKPVLRPNEWMIRPCEVYQEEYDECKSIRGRFHQYFIFGTTLDCTQWKLDYSNCYHWSQHKSETALEELIESEKKRRLERLAPHYTNDVWERRDKPPEDWNAPLPEWLQEEYKDTYLDLVNRELKEGKPEHYLKKSCTIL